MTTMGPAFDREYALLSKIEALTIERDCYKAALERIAAHGCCVMHNDSGCPGCGAKDALAGKSRQVTCHYDGKIEHKPTDILPLKQQVSSDECAKTLHVCEKFNRAKAGNYSQAWMTPGDTCPHCDFTFTSSKAAIEHVHHFNQDRRCECGEVNDG